MKHFIIIFIILLSNNIKAQNYDTSRFITSINFNFNNRFNYSVKKLYNIHGFKIGFTIFQKHKFGIGFNYLYTKLYYLKTLSIDNITYNIKSPLTYYFISAFYEPILYQDKHWELSFPFQIGVGPSYFSYWIDNKHIKCNNESIINLESVLSGHYKIFWWVGIGSGFGYNYNIKANSQIQKSFNGFVFYAKIKVFVGDIYRRLYQKNNKK
ncbi:MAG: hypothetical protein HPY79_08240 [Bacteroidales bacterium]|nr:hypothetical protein [Bacteroidales bacterium]